MKILQVNCVYKKGSTGKIVQDIHSDLKENDIESIVCYGRGEEIIEKNVHKVCGELYSKVNNLRSRITGIMYGGCYFSTRKLIKVIKEEEPDIVHLHCINGYFVNIYYLVSWLKENNIKTVLTLHAEFMYTGGCGHSLDCEKWNGGCGNCPQFKKETKSLWRDATHIMWKRMRKSFSGFDDNLVIVSVSPWLKQRAEKSIILGGKKHCVILNGLDTEIFKLYNSERLRAKHNLTDEKIIFHATPFFDDKFYNIKGGHFVLQLAEMLKGKKIKIFVAGRYDTKMSVPSNVVLLGAISEQRQLAEYYAMADITLLTSKRETFSMIVAESLCCGTPVVGFKAGGPEQITIPEYSEFVEYGKVEVLKEKIEEWLDREYFNEVISENARKKYAKKKMTADYMEIYLGMEKGNI